MWNPSRIIVDLPDALPHNKILWTTKFRAATLDKNLSKEDFQIDAVIGNIIECRTRLSCAALKDACNSICSKSTMKVVPAAHDLTEFTLIFRTPCDDPELHKLMEIRRSQLRRHLLFPHGLEQDVPVWGNVIRIQTAATRQRAIGLIHSAFGHGVCICNPFPITSVLSPEDQETLALLDKLFGGDKREPEPVVPSSF